MKRPTQWADFPLFKIMLAQASEVLLKKEKQSEGACTE